MYDGFLDAQELAYAKFQTMYNNLGYFIMEDNLDGAMLYWDAHETARAELQLSCISLDETFFEGFLPKLYLFR